MLITCLNVSASVFSQEKISLDVKKAKLSRVLKLIEEQSKYRFAYSSNYVPVNKDVSIKVTNTPVTDVVNEILENTKLNYSVSYAGFASQEISLNGQTNLNVVMQEDAKQLGEVHSARFL